jgi:MFS family permease
MILLVEKIIRSTTKSEEEQNLNATVDVYAKQDGQKIIFNTLSKEESSLRFKYLFAFSIIRAATWIKAPYLFALYNRLHLFDRQQIGILFAIDNLSSLLTGPVFGVLCDMYGRKKFCVLYCIFAISHVCLRLTGSQLLAYPAQFITGFCSCLIEIAFESWLNFEASLLFKSTLEGKKLKNAYLREIFSKQTLIDCYCSLGLSTFATLLYVNLLFY